MRYQIDAWSCGPGALTNIFRAQGYKIDQRRIKRLAGTTKMGTSPEGLISAVRSLGFVAVEYTSLERKHAWRWLLGTLASGMGVILCIDEWSHWVACIGLLGDRVIITDPANYKNNKRENGTHSFSRQQLMRRWWKARPDSEGGKGLYAVCVGKG